MEIKSLALEVKADSEEGEFTGYGSVFGNVDSQGDRIASGAFAASIAAKAPKMLWQHDVWEPIGKWTEAREDGNGLFLRGKLTLGCQRGADAYALMKDGALDGLSIGYRTKRYAMEGNTRVLQEVELVEVSLVTVPANDMALITGVKSDMSERDFETALRNFGFDRTAAKIITAQGFKGYQRHLRDAGVVGPEFDPRDVDEVKRILETTLKGGRNG